MIYDWIALHGSPVDAVIIFMGMLVVWLIRYLVQSQRAQNVRMWDEIKEVRRLYHQVDKLEAVNSLAIRVLSNGKIQTTKQSADGKGDHALNRDV